MIRINILTIFPDFFAEPLSLSIPGRAARAGLASYRVVDLREYAHDRHKTVDDEPYGGGTGMVMKPEPFFEAVDDLRPDAPWRSCRPVELASATRTRCGSPWRPN